MHIKIKKYVYEFMALLISGIVLVPFYAILINSFKTKEEAARFSLGLPEKWVFFDNYKKVFMEANIATGLYYSILLTFISTAMAVIIYSVAAFILQRRRNGFTSFIYNAFVLGMIIPGSIVVTYFMLNSIHLKGTIIGTCLVYVAASAPLNVVLYISAFKGVPVELDESAVIDGCRTLRMFYEIVFPLVKPMTATIIVLTSIGVWNDFSTVLYLFNSSNRFTLTLTMFNFYAAKSTDWSLVFADIVLVSLPIVTVYLFLQQYIISGLTSGAVKG